MEFNFGLALVLCFFSVITYAGYMVLLKSTKERLIVLFWTNVFTYVGYLAVYFFRKQILEHDVNAVHELLYDFTLVNVPLYILMAFCWIGSLVLLNYLMEKFDVSLVVPVTEIGILFTTAGYLLLGNHFSWPVLLSVLLVFIGALISGMKKISLTDPLGDLKKIPGALLAGGLIEAGFESSVMLITFLCTHATQVTERILDWLTNTFHHIYTIPFSFRHPFYYNVGVRFFITLIFLVYLLFFKKYGKGIITALFKDMRYILGVSFLFTSSILAYHESYHLMHDKNVLSALRQLIIPSTLMISHIWLKEKITPPKLIGCSIIVTGGLLSLLV